MSRKSTANLSKGVVIIAPNHSAGSREQGTIIDNMSAMYFVEYDSGSCGFIFKNEQIDLVEQT